MTDNNLIFRTRTFALDVIALGKKLNHDSTTDILGRQLLRAATSVGANYRSACKARSRADFISKIGIVEEEADECMYWLELLREAKIVSPELIDPLHIEARELTAIFCASGKTAKNNRT